MYLRDIAVHADDAIVERYKGGFVQRFHREASSVVEPYLAEIYRKVITDNSAKVGWTFTDELTEPPEYSPGCCFYPWPFDFSAYTASPTNYAKQKLILATLHNALLWIADREGWAIAPFEAAFNAIIDRNFKFVGYLKKSWLCPQKRFRARLYFDWQLDGIGLFAVLSRNRGKMELARVQLGTAIPMAGILHEYLNAGKWKSCTKFAVIPSLLFHKEWVVDFADPIEQNAKQPKPSFDR
jgi:hypothetical protein